MESRIPRLEERRAHYRAMDRGDRMERMIHDIVSGVPKQESPAVTDEIDSTAWDELVQDIERIQDAGHTVAFTSDD